MWRQHAHMRRIHIPLPRNTSIRYIMYVVLYIQYDKLPPQLASAYPELCPFDGI